MANGEDPVVRALRRANSYLREFVSHRRRKELRDALGGDEDKLTAYELSNGTRSAKEVKDDGDISVSTRSIQRWWNDWVDARLAEREAGGSVRARYDAWVIDLEPEGD